MNQMGRKERIWIHIQIVCIQEPTHSGSQGEKDARLILTQGSLFGCDNNDNINIDKGVVGGVKPPGVRVAGDVRAGPLDPGPLRDVSVFRNNGLNGAIRQVGNGLGVQNLADSLPNSTSEPHCPDSRTDSHVRSGYCPAPVSATAGDNAAAGQRGPNKNNGNTTDKSRRRKQQAFGLGSSLLTYPLPADAKVL